MVDETPSLLELFDTANDRLDYRPAVSAEEQAGIEKYVLDNWRVDRVVET